MCNYCSWRPLAGQIFDSLPYAAGGETQALMPVKTEAWQSRSSTPDLEEDKQRSLRQLVPPLESAKGDSYEQAVVRAQGVIILDCFTCLQQVFLFSTTSTTPSRETRNWKKRTWEHQAGPLIEDNKLALQSLEALVQRCLSNLVFTAVERQGGDANRSDMAEHFPHLSSLYLNLDQTGSAGGAAYTTARVLDEIVKGKDAVKVKEMKLNHFFKKMPKSELHNHLVPEANENLDYAVQKGMHFDKKTKLFYQLPKTMTDNREENNLYFDPKTAQFYPENSEGRVLVQELIPAKDLILPHNAELLQIYWDSVKTPKHWNTGSCHHFYKTFDTICSVNMPLQDQLAAEVRRAVEQNIIYSEIMLDMKVIEAPDLTGFSMNSLGDFLEKLKPWCLKYARHWIGQLDMYAGYIQAKLGWKYPLFDPKNPAMIAILAEIMRTPTPNNADPSQALALFFAETAAGLTLHKMDPNRVVGINIVGPEHNPIARQNFESQMAILDYLYTAFDNPNIALHAGELTKDLSPSRDMFERIRMAIKHAKRIGHGTCIADSADGLQLIDEMQKKGVLVEICLASSKKILGIKIEKHPISVYMHGKVPIALGTDDPHILGTNLIQEYRKAALKLMASYYQIKEWVRNSLEYSFLPGESIFQHTPEKYTLKPVFGLEAELPDQLSPDAQAFVVKSLKAQMQVRMERELLRFERDPMKAEG